jgi:hypothetical protein
MNTKLIALAEIDDDKEFWCGSIFRLYGVGMNVKEEKDDYYDYMLIDNHDEYMILANVTRDKGRHKAGYVIANVKKLENVNRIVVTAKAMKYSFGIENTFWISEE